MGSFALLCGERSHGKIMLQSGVFQLRVAFNRLRRIGGEQEYQGLHKNLWGRPILGIEFGCTVNFSESLRADMLFSFLRKGR